MIPTRNSMARAAFRIGFTYLPHGGGAGNGQPLPLYRSKGAHGQYLEFALLAKRLGVPEDPPQSRKHLFHLIGHVGRMEPEMKSATLAGCGIQSFDSASDSARHRDEASDSVAREIDHRARDVPEPELSTLAIDQRRCGGGKHIEQMTQPLQ